MQVLFLGWKDPLGEEMAPHCSILAERIPRTEEPGGLQFMGFQRVKQVRTSEQHSFIIPLKNKSIRYTFINKF